jgi:hypothetical protein
MDDLMRACPTALLAVSIQDLQNAPYAILRIFFLHAVLCAVWRFLVALHF